MEQSPIARSLAHLLATDPDDPHALGRRHAALERILYVYAKLNPGICYVQGLPPAHLVDDLECEAEPPRTEGEGRRVEGERRGREYALFLLTASGGQWHCRYQRR